ncbi:type VI secretion system domain-containing protein, partial [Pseudomonas protegens]|nr:type VI secretion system domain-containing protein [Pseudomonas protegens]
LRLNRALLWFALGAVPGRDREQGPALRALPADKLRHHQERYGQAQYADLLVELEASRVPKA